MYLPTFRLISSISHICFYIIVRFLVLVTTIVTKVDHGNHCSNDRGNDRGNDRSNHRGYYDGYYDGNAFFLQEYIFFDDFALHGSSVI